MYLFTNRDNVIIDIVQNVRYIKAQQNPKLIIACSEKEGTGVIGSDSNTFYPLIKTDVDSKDNAVNVIEYQGEIPVDYVPYLYVYNGTIEYRYNLEEMKKLKQDANKKLFAAFLTSHPLSYNGKFYGVTQEDQSEINLKLSQYNIALQQGIETPTLEWHAKGEEDEPWTYDALSELNLAIANFVYPHYHKCQQYKVQIYECTSIQQVQEIEISYGVTE